MTRTTMPQISNADFAGAKRLRYLTDAAPGLTRKRSGRGFAYREPNGRLVRDAATLRRIRMLAIPPAWTEVWICPAANGHIQATGRDSRARKQYIYHPQFRRKRDENKYERMVKFARALPSIRARVAADLSRRGMRCEKVLATVVRLLETTSIRVGNQEYARANGSFGLTTLKNRHVRVDRTRLHFNFRGKGGKVHEIDVEDPQLARIVKRCQELPGQELFVYLDRRGRPHSIGSKDVNDYLRRITGEEFTAKDFRTWNANRLAAEAIAEASAGGSGDRVSVKKAVSRVAERLGNTSAICRKSYIHPAVIEACASSTTSDGVLRPPTNRLDGLSREENAVLGVLRKTRSTRPSKGPPIKPTTKVSA